MNNNGEITPIVVMSLLDILLDVKKSGITKQNESLRYDGICGSVHDRILAKCYDRSSSSRLADVDQAKVLNRLLRDTMSHWPKHSGNHRFPISTSYASEHGDLTRTYAAAEYMAVVTHYISHYSDFDKYMELRVELLDFLIESLTKTTQSLGYAIPQKETPHGNDKERDPTAKVRKT